MKYYPVHLDINHKPCLVVGSGRVGLRKTRTLLSCGATVTVVGPVMDPGFHRLDFDRLKLVCRKYDDPDLEGMFLAFAATDNREVNRRVQAGARERNILCNIADDPEGSAFILPSIVQQGDLVITVSTCGTSPAFARYLKQGLEKQFGPHYAQFLWLMGRLRKKMLAMGHAPEDNSRIFSLLVQGGLLELVEKKDVQGIDELLESITSVRMTYKDLMA